jgi:hypothetical protein
LDLSHHADLLRGHDGGANKTGSLDGVRTLAGYATSAHGQVHFVISLRSNDGAMRFRLLERSSPLCSPCAHKSFAMSASGQRWVIGRRFGDHRRFRDALQADGHRVYGPQTSEGEAQQEFHRMVE